MVKQLIEINVDFDGTCVTHEFPNIGKEIGAAPVLKKLTDRGHRLILFTMRSDRPEPGDTGHPDIMDTVGPFLTEATEWFKKHDIPLYGIQTNPTQHKWTKSPKSYAHKMIDDSAIGCPLVYPENGRPYADWNKIEKLLIQEGIL